MKSMLKLLLILTILYLLICGAACWFQRKLIFLPGGAAVPPPGDLGIDAERVAIMTGDGVTLEGWWGRGGSPYTLIWCHGNAGSLLNRAAEFRELMAAGFDVLLFDYRGYGNSEGSPSAEGVKRDALAVFDFLKGRGVPEDRIVAYGRSIGSGPASFLANRRPLAGLVLVQPFTSLKAMAKHAYPFLPVGLLLFERLDNAAELARYEGPLLVMHGDRDDIVPFAMGKALHDGAMTKDKTFVPLAGGDHNGLSFTHGEAMREALKTFLDGLETP